MKASCVFASMAWLLLGVAAQAPAPAARSYPITKVVNLLKEMQKDLETEAEKDEEVDEKMKCWCNAAEKSKTESIANTEAQVSNLGGVIAGAAADSSRVTSEIAGHEEDLSKSQESFTAAEAQRQKQAEAFVAEEKEMEESLSGVTSALETLREKSAEKASFLSSAVSTQTHEKALDLLKELSAKHKDLLMGVISPHQRKLMLSLTSSHVNKQSLSVDIEPAAGEVLGIMSQMKDTFEANLEQTRSEENASVASFQSLRAAKQAEIKATEEALVQKNTQLAAAKEKGAQAKEDLKDAEATLTADQKFLQDAQQKCAAHDASYIQRVKTRTEEIEGCSKAEAILADDAARDTFSKTFNGGTMFLQTASADSHRAVAAKLLSDAASKTHDSRLAALAMTARLDAFEKVKEEIESLSASLAQMQGEEVQKKDSCIARLHDNTLDTDKSTVAKTQSESKLQGFQDQVSQANETMKTLNSAIVSMKKELATAKDDMELKSKEAAQTIKDQQEARKLLRQAADVLAQVYGTSLLQQDLLGAAPAAAPAAAPVAAMPEGLSSYTPSRKSGGVMAMLEQIIGDTKVLEAESQHAIDAAKKDYETFMADTEESIAAKEQSLVDLGVQKSEVSKEVLSTKVEVKEIKSTLDSLSDEKDALKEECDFLIKNFDLRQGARAQEMEALQTAKAVLSGMQMDSPGAPAPASA